MERRHADYIYSTKSVQDCKDGFGALDLYRDNGGESQHVGRVIYWDAMGQFFVEPTKAEVPLAVFEEFVAEARIRINPEDLEETVTLFRPTGPKELDLVKAAGFKAWPPRLPEQPIFYPVTNEEYAWVYRNHRQI